jgi:hypothetical protein
MSPRYREVPGDTPLPWYRAARIRVKAGLSDTLALRYQEWRGGESNVVLPALFT